MILVDTSVWVHHLRGGDQALAELLDEGRVLTHPFVVSELALGNLHQREIILAALSNLPQASVATELELLRFIDRHALFGQGIGHVDVHLLASVLLTPDAKLWSSDKRLHAIAARMGVATGS